MGDMATWRDGPEYAPHERPEAFVDPRTAPLAAPVSAPSLATAPAEEPLFTPPQQPTPDLASLIPSAGAGRDPRLAFEVISTPLTSTTPPAPTAWGAAHATAPPASPARTEPVVTATWTPQQPIPPTGPAVQGSIPMPPPLQAHAPINPASFPAPPAPPFYPPPAPGQRYGQAPGQVTFNQVWQAVTPGVFIALVVGAVLSWLSVLMLLMAYSLAIRVQYRRRLVRMILGGAAGLVAAVGGVTLWLDDFYLTSAWDNASGVAQVLCWLLPFAVGLVTAVALTRGERPEL